MGLIHKDIHRISGAIAACWHRERKTGLFRIASRFDYPLSPRNLHACGAILAKPQPPKRAPIPLPPLKAYARTGRFRALRRLGTLLSQHLREFSITQNDRCSGWRGGDHRKAERCRDDFLSVSSLMPAARPSKPHSRESLKQRSTLAISSSSSARFCTFHLRSSLKDKAVGVQATPSGLLLASAQTAAARRKRSCSRRINRPVFAARL
jgi:hypothetical protein